MTGTKQHYVIKPGILAGSCVECVHSTTGGRLHDRKQTCPGICDAPGSGIWHAQRLSISGDNPRKTFGKALSANRIPLIPRGNLWIATQTCIKRR